MVKKRTNKTMALFLLIVCFIFIGSMGRWLTYFAIVAVIICSIAISYSSKTKADIDICKGILLLLILQNFCIGTGAHIANNQDSSLQLLTQIPFLSISVIWFCTCVLNTSFKNAYKTRVLFSILMCFTLFSALIGFGGFSSSMVSLRNMIVFYMAYSLGRKNINNRKNVNSLIRFMYCSGIILTVFGLLFLYLGYDFYKALGIHEVYIAKAAPFSEGGYDGRFYTSLFSDKTFIRMGSLYYEPVSLAYYLAACLICSIYSKNNLDGVFNWGGLGIICLGLLCTVGKGGYMITAGVIICMFLEKCMNRLKKKYNIFFIKKMIICCVIICGVVYVIYYSNTYGNAVLNHIWAIQQTWANIMAKPYGYGLGTGGNSAQIFSEKAGDWLATGGETALLSMMYQIGIQGCVCFIGCLISMSFNIKSNSTDLSRAFFYIPFVLIGVSLLQDNTYTPQCIVSFMFILGALSCDEYENESDDHIAIYTK